MSFAVLSPLTLNIDVHKQDMYDRPLTLNIDVHKQDMYDRPLTLNIDVHKQDMYEWPRLCGWTEVGGSWQGRRGGVHSSSLSGCSSNMRASATSPQHAPVLRLHPPGACSLSTLRTFGVAGRAAASPDRGEALGQLGKPVLW